MAHVAKGVEVIEADIVGVGEPEPKHPAALVEGEAQKLNAVYCLDTTGSMQEYINGAKAVIQDATAKLNSANVKQSVVFFKDHPPQDTTYVTKIVGPTTDVQSIVTALGKEVASGGGDAPEAIDAALHEARVLLNDADSDATKIVVIITDAPPHGIGVLGDGFSQGTEAKGGWDPVREANALTAIGARIYCVLAPRALRDGRTAAFYKGIADKSGGRVIPLAPPSSQEGRNGLLQALYGLADESIEEDGRILAVGRLMTERQEEYPDEDLEQSQEAVYRALSQSGTTTSELVVAETPIGADHSNIFKDAATLAEAMSGAKSAVFEESDTPVYRHLSAPPYRNLSATAPPAKRKSDDELALPRATKRAISRDDVSRAFTRYTSKSATA